MILRSSILKKFVINYPVGVCSETPTTYTSHHRPARARYHTLLVLEWSQTTHLNRNGNPFKLFGSTTYMESQPTWRERELHGKKASVMVMVDLQVSPTFPRAHPFARLPLLEDFHIVASDMSDKVINLLRPVFPVPGSTSTSTRVRLPCLRYLKLVNCQRLTGEAILKALVERVAWTEAVCPESTLAKVATTWDRHVLSISLGRRLRTE